jgi:HD-GYP domain-containing protein (c-di-GMP phosphodiesterase class II)
MKRISLLFVILLLSSAAFAVTDAELMQQAKTKYAAGQAEEAIRILDTLTAASPGNLQAKKVLADICVDTGEREYGVRNFKNAFEFFKKAVKLAPTHPIATERYWAMKNEFDVNNLKNESGALPAQSAVPAQTAAVSPAQKDVKTVEEKTAPQPKAKIQKIKEPKTAEQEYLDKVLQMEARFNKRIIDMATQSQKIAQVKEENWFTAMFKNNTALLVIAVLASILSLIALAYLTNLLIKYIQKLQKERNGKSEYDSLFGADTASASYNELIKMQNIKDILNKIKCGEIDWTSIKKSISEMDRELRIEVLNLIETKLDRERQPLTIGQADLLMCLILDGDEYLRKRVNLFLAGQIGRGPAAGQFALPYKTEGRKGLPQIAYNQKDSLVESSIMGDLNIVIPLSKIIDRKVFKDNHCQRVGVDCFYMAGLLGLDASESNLFYIAGLLHDIGFLDVPSEIFNKRGSLSKEEFEIIKSHAEKGLTLLDFTDIPELIRDGILYHHEKWSGGGYPEGLKGKEIPLVAQVVSLFDIYEALILPRPQRPPFPVAEAIKVIKKGSKKLFNPDLMEPFNHMVKENMLSREEIWKE